MTDPRACERLDLVEAGFDGRLDPPERAALDRHVATCAACADRRRDLEELRASLRSMVEPMTPLAHRRGRIALLAGAAGPPPSRRRSPLVLAAAVALVPVAVWAAASSLPSRRSAEVAEAVAAAAPSNVLAPPPLVSRSTAPAPSLSPAPAPESPSAAPSAAPARPEKAPTPERAAAAASNAPREFADAMRAVERGDFAAGAEKLDRFAASHPRDPRAEEALYLEAIALERAGRIEEARAVARRYLAAYPDGGHRVPSRRLAGD